MQIAENNLGYVAEVQRNVAVAVRCVDSGKVLNRREVVQITNCATHGPVRASSDFLHALWRLGQTGSRTLGVAWRLARRGLLGDGQRRLLGRSASGRLPLLLWFSGDRSFHGGARRGKAWRRRNEFRNGRLGFGKQRGDWVDQSANHVGGRHRRRLQGFMVIEHPSGEHGFRRLLNPLIDQGGYFLPQIRGVIEPRQLKTLQRSARSRLEIIERRSESRYGHGQSSNSRSGPEGPASKIIRALY